MNIIETVLTGIASLYFGSVEYRMRQLRKEVNQKADKEDMKELMDLKNEPLKVLLKELKEDIKEIKEKF